LGLWGVDWIQCLASCDSGLKQYALRTQSNSIALHKDFSLVSLWGVPKPARQLIWQSQEDNLGISFAVTFDWRQRPLDHEHVQ
jgi:hypothetical protein